MLFDSNLHAFRVVEVVPARGIQDNMKTAVDRIGAGKERDANARFLALTKRVASRRWKPVRRRIIGAVPLNRMAMRSGGSPLPPILARS